MSLVRWHPFFNTRWPSIWDDEDFLNLTTAGRNNLEVYETDDEVIVKANVAGVKPENVDLTFDKGVLWIKAERTEEESDKAKKHYSKSAWSYSYKVAVPGTLDLTKEPDAEIDDGVLSIKFAKAEMAKPKKLNIKSKEK